MRMHACTITWTIFRMPNCLKSVLKHSLHFHCRSQGSIGGSRGRSRGNRGRGRRGFGRGRSGGGSGNKRQSKTAEELDAELDAYHDQVL